MTAVRHISEQLSPAHHVDAFRCGVEALDRWLVDHARHAQAMRTAQTFVWHSGNYHVQAYFSLAAHLIRRDELPQKLGRGSPASIPAVMLARLALDEPLQGVGVGGDLLWDALGRSCAAADIAAARLVVVDAISPTAADFYRHHGFVPIPDIAGRMVQKVNDIIAALDTSG